MKDAPEIAGRGGACLRSRVRLASAIEGRNLLQGKGKMNAREVIRQEMLKSAESLRQALEDEERTGEAIDSMNRAYWEGYLEALSLAVSKLEKVGA